MVSDNYDNGFNLAKGVGIQLRNSSNSKNMIFLDKMAVLGGAVGWYPVFDGEPIKEGSTSDPRIFRYAQVYTAILKQLPGIVVTSGKVKATATVVVQIQ